MAQNPKANHSVNLKWNWKQGLKDHYLGFHIQRSDQPKGPYSIIGTSTRMEFQDTGVIAGKVYYYIITTYNLAGDSKPSVEVSIIVPSEVPESPIDLTISAK